MKFLNSIVFLLLFGSSFCQDDCRAYFSEGAKLTYSENSQNYGIVTINGNLFIEKYPSSKTTITSRCEWLSDCSFKLTIIKTKGKTTLKVGQSMVLKITRIDAEKAYYTYQGGSENENYYIKL